MTTGRARTMAAHLSRPQNQTCDRLAMEVTYCWCVPFFRTSLLLAPLDLCTYGYGVPLRPGPPASLAGGVFYWLCGTDLFAQQGAERLLFGFGYQGRTGFSPFCHSHGGHHVAESEPAKRSGHGGSRYAHGPAQGQPGAPASHRPGTHARVLSPRGRAAIHASSALHRAQAPP